MTTKLVIFVAVVLFGQVLAAPKPFDWKQLVSLFYVLQFVYQVNRILQGQRALNLGKQAVPVVQTGCHLLNGQPMPPQVYYVNVPYQYPGYPPRGNIPIQYSPPNVPGNGIEDLS
jgi:hypothetical protein